MLFYILRDIIYYEKKFLQFTTITVIKEAKISIPSTKIIRLGPAGFTGTVALFKVVNAGVFS